MLYFLYPLEGFLIIALALGLGLFLHHRLGMPWRLYVVGALTFIASQVVHIPLLVGITALFSQQVLPSPPAQWLLPFNAVLLYSGLQDIPIELREAAALRKKELMT